MISDINRLRSFLKNVQYDDTGKIDIGKMAKTSNFATIQTLLFFCKYYPEQEASKLEKYYKKWCVENKKRFLFEKKLRTLIPMPDDDNKFPKYKSEETFCNQLKTFLKTAEDINRQTKDRINDILIEPGKIFKYSEKIYKIVEGGFFDDILAKIPVLNSDDCDFEAWIKELKEFEKDLFEEWKSVQNDTDEEDTIDFDCDVGCPTDYEEENAELLSFLKLCYQYDEQLKKLDFYAQKYSLEKRKNITCKSDSKAFWHVLEAEYFLSGLIKRIDEDKKIDDECKKTQIEKLFQRSSAALFFQKTVRDILAKYNIPDAEAIELSSKYTEFCNLVFDELKELITADRKFRIESDPHIYLDRSIYGMKHKGILLPEYICALNRLIDVLPHEGSLLSPELVYYMKKQEKALLEINSKAKAFWEKSWHDFCTENGADFVNAGEDYAKAFSFLKFETVPNLVDADFSKPEDKKAFVFRVRSLMKRKSHLLGRKVDKSDLAKMCSVSAQAASDWLNEKKTSSIKADNIYRLSRMLDSSIGYLLGETDDFKDYQKEPGAGSKIQIYKKHVEQYDNFPPDVKNIATLLEEHKEDISRREFGEILRFIKAQIPADKYRDGDVFKPDIEKIAMLLSRNEENIKKEDFEIFLEFINKIIYRKNMG